MRKVEKPGTDTQRHATLKRVVRGLVDRPNHLRLAGGESKPQESERGERQVTVSPRTEIRKHKRSETSLTKQRFGLPKGFVPRPQRYGKSILLEENIYRLPNGKEVIPCHPSGTLGRPGHLYALVTAEQYERGERGSVYARTDGRIFDYSVDDADSGREMFDTGYTIRQLERTGRYVPTRALKEKPVDKPKRTAQAG